MSLAEDLLADFEDDNDDEELEEMMPREEEEGDGIEEVTEEAMPLASYNRVTDVAKLVQSEKYVNLMKDLTSQLALTEIPELRKPVENDPQYQLVVGLSELSSDIDQEIAVIHKFVKDKYEKRFPELESLVLMPLDYIRTVKILGNNIAEMSRDKDKVGEVLPPAIVMVVSVTASASQGKVLEPDELEVVMEACDMAIGLHEDGLRMQEYVKQRMALIAPNLCNIVGAGTAALLVAQAGGLVPLAKQPACNFQVLGKQKRSLAGLSSTSQLPYGGYIYSLQIVQSLPPDHRKTVSKLICNKSSMAARIDSLHESPDGSAGREFAEQIQQKIEKLLEPPPVKNNKALPKPLDKASKKRGGRRVRRQKELNGLSDLRRKANRVNFGELQEDVSQEHMGFTLGQAASTSLAGGGRIRSAVVDNRTRVRMSQKLQRQLERQKQLGGATTIKSKAGGTVSSISFTPVQGLEIINASAKDNPAPTSTSTYFSSTASFIKVQTPLPKP